MSDHAASVDSPAKLAAEVPAWRLVDEHHLAREFTFPNFVEALAFVNAVGAIAEELNHHPDISLTWGRVGIVTYSHDINGLSPRDVRLAQRIDALAAQRKPR